MVNIWLMLVLELKFILPFSDNKSTEEGMKRYCIKSRPDKSEYLDILSETDEGYKIRLTKVSDGDEKIKEDFINRHLFDICVKTGYLAELAAVEFGFSAA